MSRQHPGLGPPPAELAGFPSFVTEGRLWRAGRAHHRSLWWFSSRTGNRHAGRFDLAAPRGTCHLGDDPLGVLLETLVAPGNARPVVSSEALRVRVVWETESPEPVTVADAAGRAAAGFGMTRELGTLTPYDLPWAWADALDAAGFGGVRWWLRFDPGPGRGVALFGPRGARDGWPAEQRTPAIAWRRALEDDAGIRVLDVPALDELDHLDRTDG